ncbi:cytochrome c oxidase subunit 6b-1 [Physcomitrium patens]|uniref:Uncharacterized protein n=1 Tax=Physcomitrium patens TaxID=3218 RepID=A0A2K1IFS2_PHYPA|nr:cytochrome c oxidase subunit 6b-1-like [Physcomitrium patens]PNR28114.1 hypothetical protein PHYPA_028706 [Physcomitrium patens]|eukprot:XP_024364646.1 cytochrome c oxidase subunit 6b-1-like [Physcomitrella patens]
MGNNVAVMESVQVYEETPDQVKEHQVEEEQVEKEEETETETSSNEKGEEEAEAATEETEEAAEEEEKPKITVDDIKTAPMDFRFPTTNQAKHCFTRYNEFHKCAAEKGEDAKECQKYARYYRSLCPGEWIDKWNEERENGTYAGRY